MKTTMKSRRDRLTRTPVAFTLVAACCGWLTAQETPAVRPPDPLPPIQYAPTGTPDTKRDTTGTPVAPVAPAKSNKATGLIGMEVRGTDDKALGRIHDIVFDLKSGRVAYCILNTGGGGLFAADKLHAVPLPAFQASLDGMYLTLNVDRANLKRAPGLSADNWPSVVNPAWGAEPFWQLSLTPGTYSTSLPPIERDRSGEPPPKHDQPTPQDEADPEK